MSLNKVKIIKGAAGLGRPLPGEDHISSLIFYSSALPSGFTNSNRIKEIFSIEEAEALGITDTHIGEIRATGAFTITATGATTNDTLTINLVTPDSVINLATYSQLTVSTTPSLVAADVTALINSTSGTTGFSATASTGTVNFTVPAGTGVGANSWTYANVFTGTISASTAAISGGVASEIDVMHYHISESMRLQPKIDLYVAVYSATTDYSELTTVSNFSNGKIRQAGIFTKSNFATNMVNQLQNAQNVSETAEKPLEVFLQANFANITDLSTLSDLHALNSHSVSVIFGQDAGAKGYELFLAAGKSIGTVGAFLGANALAKVSESVAWAQKFRLDNIELEKLAMANGTALTTLSSGLIDAIDSKGYVFVRYLKTSGTVFVNPYTSISLTSDYSRVPNNRTINKTARSLRAFLEPYLASPVVPNADGTLSNDTIEFFKLLCVNALEAMINNQEVSAFEVIINPVQDVISTGNLVIGVSIVPIGSADNIIVNLGFKLSI